MELDKKQLRKQLIQMRLAFDDYQKQSHFIIEKLKKDPTLYHDYYVMLEDNTLKYDDNLRKVDTHNYTIFNTEIMTVKKLPPNFSLRATSSKPPAPTSGFSLWSLASTLPMA